MKHIQKKFLNEVPITDEVANKLSEFQKTPLGEINKVKEFPKDMVPFFTTDDNKLYQAFLLKINGQTRVIPEPDPILVYFDTAYMSYVRLADKKSKLIQLTEKTLGTEPAIIELYEYFGLVSSVVIFLFTTIEAAMNRCIPTKYTFIKVLEKKTETYNKHQIESTFSFEDKLKKILIDVTKKSFHKSFPLKYQQIINLKNFRDSIIHTKSIQDIDSEKHNYSRAFTFDFEKAVYAVKDFCNFYIDENFIVDCNCSYDW